MPGGRKSKPAALKLVEGRAPGKDTAGRPIPEPPQFKRLPPERPDDLSPDAAELWDLLIGELSRLEIVATIHGPSLQACCESWARWRTAVRMRQENGLLAETSQGIGVAPWVRIEESSAKEFRQWCAEFGLTAAAEAKLSTGGPDGEEEDNPFAGGATGS